MANEAFIAGLEDQIVFYRGVLESLESGTLQEESPARTRARILDLKRRIADNQQIIERLNA